MISQIEKTILSAYLITDSFSRTVTAHIDPSFFESEVGKVVGEISIKFTKEQKSSPSKTTLLTLLENKKGLSEKVYTDSVSFVEEVFKEDTIKDIKNTDADWLLKETETWCKQRSVFNAIIRSVDIIEGKDKERLDKAAIPELMQKALAISFDSSIGHNYIGEYQERYSFMHSPVSKIPFNIPILNHITGGGIERKSLSLLLCPAHSGKSLCLSSFAADWIRMGYNVLGLTLEMAEMKIGERIDANMLDVEISKLKQIPKDTYYRKFEEFKNSGYGQLIIKEYPTNSAGASHFRFLLQELEVKQGFVPDIIVLDYLGICASSRYKNSDNMYQVQKAVGEEIRALAQEKDIAIVSAVQTNKNGFGGADFDITDISESSAHSFTADFILGIISTDELIAMNQARFKQLKNRWGSIHENGSFILNMDRKKMRVYSDVSANLTKPVKSQKFDNILNKEEDDTPFVFNPSMIRPKKDYTQIGKFDGL